MAKKNLATFVLLMLVVSLPATAGEFKQWLKSQYEATHYQQETFALEDPKGDAFLMRKLDQVPTKLIQALVKGSYPQAEIQKEKELKALEESMKDKAGFKIGKTVPIDVDRLINKCREIILSYYPHIIPVLGEEHRWSPEAKRYLAYGFWHRLGRHIFRKQKEFPSPLFFRSKLFLLLACGWTSRYAVTGQERALTERIMRYPDGKLQLHHMFMESYVLNRGNIYLSMLTAENVLAGDPYRVDRENDPVQKKLAYLRHDTVQMGDNYGAWYHFFGIGMYAIVRTGLISRSVAEIESLGSLVLEGADKQEDYINRYGAIFGKKFRKMLKDETWKQPLALDESTDYMLPNPALAADGKAEPPAEKR
ncbi:MAG: hypothetical protein A2W80_12790 [Candidatus Riflebacteria bacterium GWC2_50_8]|nr:MAG: hypothetical protein A2W80_12790 [Candidatus Riflebacteria bacterium GWC2_50_8]